MGRWFACFVFVLLSAAIATETDPRPNSSEKLQHWRREQKSGGNGYTFPTSALGKRPEDENDGGTVPTHLTPAHSHADIAGQHGLDHQAVFIDLPWLECECKFSLSASTSDIDGGEHGGAACREGGEAYWIVSVRGLVPGFSYNLHFKWSIADEQLGAFGSVFSAADCSYTVRTPLAESGQNGTSTFDLIAHSRKLRMDVAVWDVYPGLTEGQALIGARHMDPAVNTVRVLCTVGHTYASNTSIYASNTSFPTTSLDSVHICEQDILSDSELGFVQRLSKSDVYEIVELVGIHLPMVPMPSDEWGSYVINRVRCLSADGILLVQEALAELGHSGTEAQGAGEEVQSSCPTPAVGTGIFDRVDRRQRDNEGDAQANVDRKSPEDDNHKKLMQEERLLAPGSCWNPARGPQVFFADPPVHLDPHDPTRHVEQEAGRLSTWDFRSEEIRLRAGVCFPPGSKPARPRSCKVLFSHMEMSEAQQKSGEVICSAPFGNKSKHSYDLDTETRVLTLETHSYNADKHQDPVLLTFCTPLLLFDFSPGTAWFSLNLTCVGGEEGGREGGEHKHHARMNAEVHWQRQDWTQQAAAWGAGLHAARGGEKATFYVQMVSREGRNVSVGGDHLVGHLSGPALLCCDVSDLGNGTYAFAYVAWEAGVYSLEVQVTFLAEAALLDSIDTRLTAAELKANWRNGSVRVIHPRDIVYAHIRGSPFSIEITPFRASTAREREGRRGAAVEAVGEPGSFVVSGYDDPRSEDEGSEWMKRNLLCTEDSAGRILGGHGVLHELEFVFEWCTLQWIGNASSLSEYHMLAQQIKDFTLRESLSVGDVLFVGSHPYDIFNRPLATVREGARLVAQVLAEIAAGGDAPLVLFRNADALHLPWLSFGKAMWFVNNGLSSARGLYVHSMYEQAMRERRVKVLDPLPVTRARTDKSHDGLHYFHRKSRDGELRQQMALFSNEVGHVLLQLLFNAICNGHMQTAMQATGVATGNAGM